MLRTVSRTAAALIVLLSVFSFSSRAAGDCTYLVDFPRDCNGQGCNRAPYAPVYSEQWCEPWVGELYGYPFIKYAAFERQYDCEGDSCVCQPTCFPIDLCAYDTMAECQEKHHGTRIECEDEYYNECSPDGGGFPPPDCPKGDVCCIGGGGGGGPRVEEAAGADSGFRC